MVASPMLRRDFLRLIPAALIAPAAAAAHDGGPDAGRSGLSLSVDGLRLKVTVGEMHLEYKQMLNRFGEWGVAGSSTLAVTFTEIEGPRWDVSRLVRSVSRDGGTVLTIRIGSAKHMVHGCHSTQGPVVDYVGPKSRIGLLVLTGTHVVIDPRLA